MDTDPTPQDPQPVLFRPSKKRKIYRQRATSPTTSTPQVNEGNESSTAPPADSLPLPRSSSTSPHEPQDYHLSIAAIRRIRANRKHGVEFRASTSTSTQALTDAAPAAEEEQQLQLVEHGEPGVGAAKRFVSQTGTRAEAVDRHMMAYIDSELARRLYHTSTSTSTTATTDGSPPLPATAQSALSTQPAEPGQTQQPQQQRPTSPPHQTTSRGKLLEIDLSAEPNLENRTRSALLQQPPSSNPPTAALGRNGRPLRPHKCRGKTRTEEDIRRDALVDAVLRENRLEHYEPPAPPPERRASGEEGDEEIAEAFRREFMEGVRERGRRGGGAGGTGGSGGGGKGGKGGKGKEEEGLRGPKLGGSRSARAAVREALIKAERGKR